MPLTTQYQKDGAVLESLGAAQPSCIQEESFCASLLGQKGLYINIRISSCSEGTIFVLTDFIWAFYFLCPPSSR